MSSISSGKVLNTKWGKGTLVISEEKDTILHPSALHFRMYNNVIFASFRFMKLIFLSKHYSINQYY